MNGIAIDLCNQQYQDLIELGLSATIIHGNNKKLETTNKSIQEYFNKLEATEANVLLITWESYFNLDKKLIPSSFAVIGDEVPKAYNPYRIMFEKLRADFRANVELYGNIKGSMQAVKASNPSNYSSMVKQLRRTSFNSSVFDLLNDIANKNKQVFVNIDDWDRLINSDKKYKDGKSNIMRFVSILRANVIKDVVLLGNKIENSILYSLYKDKLLFTDFGLVVSI